MKSLKEGLLDVLKARKQITQLQGAVADEYERLIEQNPKRYRSGRQVLGDVQQFAQQEYKKIVTVDDAISFNNWWKEFSDAHERMLDRTVFAN